MIVARARSVVSVGVSACGLSPENEDELPRKAPVTAAESPNVNVQVQMPPATAPAAETPEEKPDMWFWDQLAAIPTEKWGRVNSVIGERVDPKVPGVPGSKGFLFELFEPITLSYFKNNYGGGTFKAVLMENGRFKTSHQFNIFGTPKYDLTRESPAAIGGATVAQASGSEAKILGMLESQIGRLNEELSASRAQGKENPALTEAITILSTAYKESVATLGSNSGNGGGNSTVIETIKALKELGVIGAEHRKEKSLLEQLTELLTHPLIGPQLLELFKPKNPLEQLSQLKSVVEVFDGLRGSSGGGDGKKDWRAMLAEGVVQKGPELIKEIRETLEVGRDAAVNRRVAAEANARTMEIARTIPSPTPSQPPIPAAPLPATSPSVMPGTEIRVVPIDSVSPAAAPPAAPPAAANMTEKESDVVAVFMKRKIVQMLRAGVDSDEIVNFIETVDPAVCDLILQNSPEMITTFLNGDPILKEATALPDWLDFLADAQDAIREKRGAVPQPVPN